MVSFSFLFLFLLLFFNLLNIAEDPEKRSMRCTELLSLKLR